MTGVVLNDVIFIFACCCIFSYYRISHIKFNTYHSEWYILEKVCPYAVQHPGLLHASVQIIIKYIKKTLEI